MRWWGFLYRRGNQGENAEEPENPKQKKSDKIQEPNLIENDDQKKNLITSKAN